MDGQLSPADVAVLSGNNRSGSDGMFGDNGAWWIIIFLIFAMTGWGRNGFGGGSNGSNGGAYDNYVLTSDFSQLARQISDSTAMTERKLDGITNGLCTLGYDNLVQANSINSNINNIGMNLQNCCCEVKSQLADCCCQNLRAIDGVNYNLSQGFCGVNNTINVGVRDLIDNQNANYRALHDEIVANRIEDKNAQIQLQQNEINALRLAASQEKQNAYLLSELKACPIPAYLTCNPNAPLNYSINYGNGCGCGCNN